MPDRYVRAALLGSPAWQSLPDADTKLFFVRLILLADDFGCYDGRPEVIAVNAFPGILISNEELNGVIDMLQALHVAGMIVRYSNNGKPYIAIWQWGNDLRGNRRFPAPPIDVDLEALKVRGKFGKVIGWTNPPGCSPTSILLEPDGRASVPQPPEWRPVEHMRADPQSKVGWRRPAVTGSVGNDAQIQAANDTQPVTSSTLHAANTGTPDSRVVEKKSPDAGVVVAGEHPPPVTASTPSPTINGKIKFEEGRFVGLTEAQRIAWQEMFNDLSIPDQIDRAAAWLAVNNAERQAIENQGDGFGSFIVRWLLREVRPVQSPRTGHASPTGG